MMRVVGCLLWNARHNGGKCDPGRKKVEGNVSVR